MSNFGKGGQSFPFFYLYPKIVIARIWFGCLWFFAEVLHMNRRKMLWGSVIAAGTFAAGLWIAQGQPAQNVGGKHPNLAAAQRLTAQAYEKITAAQQDNEWDMQGHAAHAKDLLDQANNELKASAEAANHHK